MGRPRSGRRARRLRWTVGLLAAAGALGGALAGWVWLRDRPEQYRPGEDDPAITRALARNLPAEAPTPRFTDVTQESGLGDFVQFRGDRSSQLPEDMGSGAAWGDYDNDGDPDLLLVSSGGALTLDPGDRAPSRLYENLGNGRFREDPRFPDTRVIGMGAAWGDYDGDGWLDLVVTGYQSLLLFHNRSGRLERLDTFEPPAGFWAGAAWGDYDGDGDLDLYVCGYVRYVAEAADRARATLQYGRSVPYTLNPSSYPPERNLLLRNDGAGTFREVAAELGVDNPEGRSLGALWHDFDQDGRLDLYVANDVSDNVLYRNVGAAFEEVSHAAWVADYRGAMGLAAGDWNRDGDDDLFITHWVAQENALYDSLLRDRPAEADPLPAASRSAAGERTGALRFIDVADQRGLGQIALRRVGWGAEFADFDADGWLDLVVVNGSTFETEEAPRRLQPEPLFLFWNRRGEHFHDLAPLDVALAREQVGRGLALADFDADGDLDLLVVGHGEGVRLLRNEMQRGHWLKLRLRSRVAPSGAPLGRGDGAVLVAEVGAATLRRTVGGASYLSQSHGDVHLGLGSATRVERLSLRWPDGETAVYADLAADATWELTQGRREARRLGSGDARAPSEEAARRGVLEFWSIQREAMRAMQVDGDLVAAIEGFRGALALRPEHEDSRYYLANCLATTGDVEAAIEELERLAEINPSSHRAFRQLGVLRATHAASPGELDRAARDLERALEINPEETGALHVLGEIALMRGEDRLAEERLGWVSQSNPRAVGALYLRAHLAWRRGAAARAEELLRAAREARGEEWKPAGTTAEGDVARRMHREGTPLSAAWEGWDGTTDPRAAFEPLRAILERDGDPGRNRP